MERNACFSEDRRHRWCLHRIWNRVKPKCVFIGLNPSTADELTNDPTVTRCQNYAESWDYGGLQMLNIFGYRATDPKDMMSFPDPIGPENDEWLLKISRNAGVVICAWGVHGKFMGRGLQVAKMLSGAGVPLQCLGVTKEGFPKHPLYLKSSEEPRSFQI